VNELEEISDCEHGDKGYCLIYVLCQTDDCYYVIDSMYLNEKVAKEQLRISRDNSGSEVSWYISARKIKAKDWKELFSRSVYVRRIEDE
jgi:hypothetical protein